MAIADRAGELPGADEALRTIAERLRGCERAGQFGAEFVESARARGGDEDRRTAIGRRIDEPPGSETVEDESVPGMRR